MKQITKNFIKGLIIGFLIGFIPYALLPIFEYLKFNNTDITSVLTLGLLFAIPSSLVMGFLFYIYSKNKKFFIVSLVIAIVLYVFFLLYLYAFYWLILSESPFGGRFG